MLVNINTLGVTYDSVIAGTALSSIINNYAGYASNEIYITGKVTYSGVLTLNNPKIKLIGDANAIVVNEVPGYESNYNVLIKQFENIDGVNINSHIKFPPDSSADGILQNITSNVTKRVRFEHSPHNTFNVQGGDGTALDLYGLRLLNLNGVAIEGGMNGVNFKNINYSRGLGDYAPNCIVGGSDNTWDDINIDSQNRTDICHKFYAHINRRSSRRNIVRNSVFSGANQEGFGSDTFNWDSFFGEITEVGSNYIVVTGIYNAARLTNANNLLGCTALVTDGNGRGKYYEVLTQSTGNLGLDINLFDTSGISVGDHVQVTTSCEGGWFYNNEVNISNTADQPITTGMNNGISFWGSSIGNLVTDNIIKVHVPKATGIWEGCFMHVPYMPEFQEYSYNLNAKNRYHRNDIVWQPGVTPYVRSLDVFFETRHVEYEDIANVLVFRPVDAVDYPSRAIGNEAVNNTSNLQIYTSAKDQLACVWDNPELEVPATNYDGRYGVNTDGNYQYYTDTGQPTGTELPLLTTPFVETVAPTTFAMPAEGSYFKRKIVTLNTNKPGFIYYTIDGSAPTTASTLYTWPIEIGVTTTVKFFAVDVWGNEETTVRTQTYSIIDPGVIVTASAAFLVGIAKDVTITAKRSVAALAQPASILLEVIPPTIFEGLDVIVEVQAIAATFSTYASQIDVTTGRIRDGNNNSIAISVWDGTQLVPVTPNYWVGGQLTE